jgi:hypothetical protein
MNRPLRGRPEFWSRLLAGEEQLRANPYYLAECRERAGPRVPAPLAVPACAPFFPAVREV